MKNVITVFIIIFCSDFFGQLPSFDLYKGTTTNVPITNNSTVSIITISNGENVNRIKIRNNSATTNTYSVLRTILYNVPALIVNNSAIKPQTFFCFGQTCLNNSANSPNSYDTLILAPPGSIYFDSDAKGKPFEIKLQDTTQPGRYDVKYKVFNIADPNNDNMTFIMSYNEILGIETNSKAPVSVSEAFPNPANKRASVNVNLLNSANLKIRVYSIDGSLQYFDEKNYLPGIHRIEIDCGSLGNGMYFACILTEDAKITKRFFVNN